MSTTLDIITEEELDQRERDLGLKQECQALTLHLPFTLAEFFRAAQVVREHVRLGHMKLTDEEIPEHLKLAAEFVASGLAGLTGTPSLNAAACRKPEWLRSNRARWHTQTRTPL